MDRSVTRRLGPMTFPAPVPEIPAADLDKGIAYYVNTLGFHCDWRQEQYGIAGVSRDNCRLFIASQSIRELYYKVGPVLFWLDSKAEVDELFAEWEAANAKLLSELEDMVPGLRMFLRP